MEVNNFQKDVIERSFHKPVVVDFWAEWCGPCRILGPVIESLAADQNEDWELVKVDTEANQEIARQYNIRSIPNVKMFVKGEVVAEFAGALPRPQIQKWLDENLPHEGAGEFETLLNSFSTIPDAEYMARLELFLLENPDNDTAKVALAKHLVFSDPSSAKKHIANIKAGHASFDDAEDIRSLARFFDSTFVEKIPVVQTLKKSQAAFEFDDPDVGIQELVHAVSLDKSYQDDLPRKAAIALFHLWGPEHPLTKKFRRLFDMMLY